MHSLCSCACLRVCVHVSVHVCLCATEAGLGFAKRHIPAPRIAPTSRSFEASNLVTCQAVCLTWHQTQLSGYACKA